MAHPSNAALTFRIEEAARRIEGLTRLVLAESVWTYYAEARRFTGEPYHHSRSVSGWTRCRGHVVTDDDGGTVAITSTVLRALETKSGLHLTSGTFAAYSPSPSRFKSQGELLRIIYQVTCGWP